MKEWMMIEGPFPTSQPKGTLLSDTMIDEKYKQDVLKLEVGECSQIYTHNGEQFVFIRTR